MNAVVRTRALIGLLGVVNLVAIAADRLKQFAFVGMLGIYAPGSSLELLKLNLFMQIPMLVFSPLFGALLDRWNKSTAMVATCVIRAAGVALIPLLFAKSGSSLYALYGLAFLLAFPDLVFAPARAAILPDVVEPQRLLQTNAAFWTLGIAGTLGGVLAGGWLFDFRSWQMAFRADAAVYALSAVLLVPMVFVYTSHMRARGIETSPSSGERPGPFEGVRILVRSIVDGVRLIREDRHIAISLVTQSGLFAMGGVASVIGIARIQEVAPVGKAFFLAIVAASLIVGLLLGSGLAAIFRRTISPQRTIAVSATLTGVALTGMGRTETIIPLSIWGALLGLSVSPVFIITETLIQHQSPRGYLGRMFAAREALVKAAYLLAAVLATGVNAFVSKETILVSLGLFLALLGVFLERTSWLKADLK